MRCHLCSVAAQAAGHGSVPATALGAQRGASGKMPDSEGGVPAGLLGAREVVGGVHISSEGISPGGRALGTDNPLAHSRLDRC